MRKQTRSAVGLLVVVTALSLATALTFAGTGAVSAQESESVEMTTDVEYDGLDGEQAIQVTATFKANTRISGLDVDIYETGASFIDVSSFETVQGEVRVDGKDGSYNVSDIRDGQEFSIRFTAYPRDLSQTQLGVAKVDLNADNPQTYDTTKTIEVNIAENNPYRALQNSGLETWQWAAVGVLAVGGLLGVGFGGYQFAFGRGKIRASKDREFVDRLRDLRADVDKPSDKDEVEELMQEYGGNTRLGGATGDSTGGPSDGDDEDEDEKRFPS